MEKTKYCVVGVLNGDVCHVLDYAMALIGDSQGAILNVVAVLLAASELSILLAKEGWCIEQDQCGTIETLRTKARDSASSIFLQFKDSQPS